MREFIECPDGTLIRKSEIVMVGSSVLKCDYCWYFEISLDLRSNQYPFQEVACSEDKEIAKNQLDLFRKRLQQ